MSRRSSATGFAVNNPTGAGASNSSNSNQVLGPGQANAGPGHVSTPSGSIPSSSSVTNTSFDSSNPGAPMHIPGLSGSSMSSSSAAGGPGQSIQMQLLAQPGQQSSQHLMKPHLSGVRPISHLTSSAALPGYTLHGSLGEFIVLPGESIVATLMDKDVTYLCPYAGPVRGSLTITNYRFYFRSTEEGDIGNIFLDVPLGKISKIEKVGGVSSKGDHAYGLEIMCKDMRSIKLSCKQENHSRRGVFDSLHKYAFPLSSGLKFFAFSYSPERVPSSENGWLVYEPIAEYNRMGVPNESWKISKINENYDLCDTYPAILAVPMVATDDDLKRVAAYRSKARIPVLSWLHPSGQASLTRCAQPQVGVTGRKSREDERYIQMIMDANAQSHKIFIMDARPLMNAVANRGRGGGYENVGEVYQNAELNFLDIANIHVMRQSLQKVFDMVFPTLDESKWFTNLNATHWLEHVRLILDGATRIVDIIEVHKTSVIVHCSDGWDRTAQLTSLAMLLLDSHYRTIHGFQILIEKEWLSFGHKFAHRVGHGDEKEVERSPVFLQWIDCVWQVMQQFPDAFQFNELLLIEILDHMYSCLYGTFLFNSEKERLEAGLKEHTHSLWTQINANPDFYTNATFSDSSKSHVLQPLASMRMMQFWPAYYARWNPNLRPYELAVEKNRELLNMKKQLLTRIDELSRELMARAGGGSGAGGVAANHGPGNGPSSPPGGSAGSSAGGSSSSGPGHLRSPSGSHPPGPAMSNSPAGPGGPGAAGGRITQVVSL